MEAVGDRDWLGESLAAFDVLSIIWRDERGNLSMKSAEEYSIVNLEGGCC